jgi:hypothetical protein
VLLRNLCVLPTLLATDKGLLMLLERVHLRLVLVVNLIFELDLG